MEGRLRSNLISIGVWWGLAIVFVVTTILWQNPLLVTILTWVGRAIERLMPNKWNIATSIFFTMQCFVFLFAAIVIHEVGHAVVGVFVGFRFNSLRIGWVQFDRPFRISRYRGKGTGSGGWTSLFPVKQDHLTSRTIMMLLAGPAANLISAWLLYLLPYVTGPGSLWFTYWSVILGCGNLRPFRSRAVFSDGARILMLLRNRAAGERWLAMLKLVAELRSGVP